MHFHHSGTIPLVFLHVCVTECDPELCESEVPSCRGDQTPIATRADDSCCLAHICSQFQNELNVQTSVNHQQVVRVISVLNEVCALCSVLLLSGDASCVRGGRGDDGGQ